jgi:predicted membrane channel-forming protein YqfA (hemolysin III family)
MQTNISIYLTSLISWLLCATMFHCHLQSDDDKRHRLTAVMSESALAIANADNTSMLSC